jgi:hypothetical protein
MNFMANYVLKNAETGIVVVISIVCVLEYSTKRPEIG